MMTNQSQFDVPEGFYKVAAHTDRLQLNDAYIAVRSDGTVDGCCFTESDETSQWFSNAIAAGAQIFRGPRSTASKMLAGTLVHSVTVQVVPTPSPSIQSVLALNGRIFAMLSPAEHAVLEFYRNQGRKFGVAVSIISDADTAELASAPSQQAADEILRRVNSTLSVQLMNSEEAREAAADEAGRAKFFREYFEAGCLCIASGRVSKKPANMPDDEAWDFYKQACSCSRNYQH